MPDDDYMAERAPPTTSTASGTAYSEEYRRYLNERMDRSFPNAGSGKPTEHPKMYYKAPKKQ